MCGLAKTPHTPKIGDLKTLPLNDGQTVADGQHFELTGVLMHQNINWIRITVCGLKNWRAHQWP